MRLLKFAAAFIIPACLIFLIAFGLNWKSTRLFFENRESMAEGSEWVDKTYSLSGLTQYVEQHPDRVSVYSVVMGAPDSTLSYGADVPRTMGTTANLFLLLGAAMELNAGNWSADEMLDWEELSRYQLPDISESSHTQSKQVAEERGWLKDGVISLDHTLFLLAEFGSLSIADFVWWKLGESFFAELPAQIESALDAGLTGDLAENGPLSDHAQSATLQDTFAKTDMPLPFSGLYLMISPEIEALDGVEKPGVLWHTQGGMGSGDSTSTSQWREHVAALSERLMDDEFAEAVQEQLAKRGLGLSFMQMRDRLSHFPQSTAREMTSVLWMLVHGEAFDPGVSQKVLQWFRWPMVNHDGEWGHEGAKLHFSEYGAIYDDRMGLLNGIDVGTSRYTGDTTLQAVFFDRLQIAFWFHMSSNHMHQDFQQRLIYDPAMIARMKRVIRTKNDATAYEPTEYDATMNDVTTYDVTTYKVSPQNN